MATELETKPAVPKYEAFVDSQLAKVRSRIRALEAGRSLLALGVVTLGYFLIMSLFDLAVHGADDGLEIAIRFAAFAAYVLVIIALLVQLGLRLYRRINPFYAAKQLEDTIADAKNSVINWLDLRERELPGAIRGAVGQRAARELKQTDPDRAVNPKSNWILGSICAGLAFGLLILFALGPNQFGSLFRRAFAPFVGSGLGTRTEITLVKPSAGDATVPLNQRVEFEARIEGRFPKVGQPGAPRLLYRYQTADPYVPLALDENPDGNWATTLNSDQVLNGLWYKIAAGDTETPEYQIRVQSLPHVQRFEITYHYRPYRKLADDKVVFPNEQAVIPRLIDYRGTEVDLVVRTNRALRQASFELDLGGTKSELPGDIPSDDPKAMRVRMKLEKRGTFRVLFTSTDGERNSDRSAYQIEVLDDQTPRVLLTKPAKDVTLPANGTLQLEGTATDDIGLTSLVLRLRVHDGNDKPALAPKPYRAGKSFQFENGTFPDFIDYTDFVPLDKVTTAKGELFPLKPGTVLEYWLEATDNCDYPNAHGNIGKSTAYKVTIADPSPDQKKQQENRRQAEQQQKQHDQKQDQQNANENQKRKENQTGNGGSQDDPQKRDFDDKANKLKDQLNKEQQQKNEAKKQESNQGNNNQTGQGGADNAKQRDANNSKQAGDKKDGGQQGGPEKANNQGDPKQNKSNPANAKEGKGSEQNKPGGAKQHQNQASPKDKGVAKEPSPGQAKESPGQAKSQGGQSEANSASKSSGQSPQLGKKDGSGNSAETQPANTNDGNSGATKSAAKFKDGHGDPREATSQNVNDAREKLRNPGREAEAREQLERIAKEAKDPQVRKAAQEALDGAGQPANANNQAEPKEGTPKDGNQQGAADAGKQGEPKADAKTGKAVGTGQDAQDPMAEAKTGGTMSDFGPNGRGATDDISKTPPNADFQKRAGDLQLETLKDRVTPETLKKLGWSEQDWQQFLRDAQKYQVRQQQTARKTGNQRGTGSQIPGASLRPVDANPTAPMESLTTERVLVPPEFRDAQRQFTTSPSGKK